MIRPGRKLTAAQRREILRIATRVKRERERLGLTQVELDQECGFVVRTVDRVERRDVGHRSFLPDDDRVVTVLKRLQELRSRHPNGKGLRSFRRSRDASKENVGPRRRPRAAPTTDPSEREEVTLTATLRWCPDQGAWVTQSACEAMNESHPVCRSMNAGRGCRGIKHRRDSRIEEKHVAVRYVPPKPGELEYDGQRWRKMGEG